MRAKPHTTTIRQTSAVDGIVFGYRAAGDRGSKRARIQGLADVSLTESGSNPLQSADRVTASARENTVPPDAF
jgi:hypothetical protein